MIKSRRFFIYTDTDFTDVQINIGEKVEVVEVIWVAPVIVVNSQLR